MNGTNYIGGIKKQTCRYRPAGHSHLISLNCSLLTTPVSPEHPGLSLILVGKNSFVTHDVREGAIDKEYLKLKS